MASPIPPDDPESPISNPMNDPFVTHPSPGGGAPLGTHHRFSHFDSSQLFALGPNASPAQAKRALEAHLADTNRRMEEAGKLGTALVQQRKELEDRLKDVEKMHSEGELSEDLRHKLVEIEKDYNDVARESARAFLPKQRVPSNEVANPGSPFALEGNNKAGRRSVSPSKFEAQATGSPTKLSVPNRKIRNQPNNRVHDIEFAAEISTSLISQVRNLQALLSEKEEELRDVKVERSKLEYEAEGLQQRVRSLDESEHRYKDENWNLETQVHELMAAQKDALDREKKLSQSLSILQTEKNAVQRELDESKLSLSKLSEDHAAAVKQHDIDLGTAKRSIVMGDSERASMQRKIDDLIGQNQELAKGYSSQRSRNVEREPLPGLSDEDFDTANDNMTPEHSPPPSPVKNTPRHSMLESETLKTSLGHAQRTIQSLRTNYHREKTEKLELRRMLQDARDEIEKVRQDPIASSNKRNSKKVESKEFRKPPRLLGGLRSARSEIFTEDPDWEDQSDAGAPIHHSLPSRGAKIETDTSDQFDTANETSDAAFETANERETETDDFHTGAEDMSSDEGAETETESPSKRRSILGRSTIFSNAHVRNPSFDSTASTEDEEYPFEHETRTPPTLPPLQPRFPLRVSRGAFRRSRQASEEPPLQSSPISFTAGSVIGTPQQQAQSLAAELGDFDGSDIESQMSATPSRRSIRGRTTSPPPAVPALPRAIMVDSGVMTEPLPGLVPGLSPASAAGIASAERPVSMNTVLSSRLSTSTYSDAGTVDMQENLAKFPSPPTSAPKRDELALSNVHEEMVEPRSEADAHGAELAALRTAHLRETESLQAEHATVLATALERLRSEHSEQMVRADSEKASAHTAALEALRADHAEETTKLRTELQNAHATALDSLRGTLAQELETRQAEMTSAHAQELNLLVSKNAEDSSSAAEEARQAHERELDAVKQAHASAIALQASQLQEKAEVEVANLKAKHAEELAAAQKVSDESLAAELSRVGASHADQLEEARNTLAASHANELEEARNTLAASHANELEEARNTLAASHANKLEEARNTLSTSHANELEEAKGALVASHAIELEGIKSRLAAAHAGKIEEVKNSLATAHANEVEEVTKKLATVHASELENNKNSLVAGHTAQLEELKSHLSLAHTNELEQAKSDLSSAHAAELQETKDALAMAHTKDLEALEARLSQDADKIRADTNAAHAEEMKLLKTAHLQAIEATEARLTTDHAQELESHKQKHAESLDKLKKDLEAGFAIEIAALTAANAKQQESSRAEAEAALAAELAALKETHFAEVKSLNEEHASAHAQELENFKAALAKQVDSSKAEGDAANTEKIEALNAAHAEIVEAHKRDSEKAQSQALESLRNQHETQTAELRRSMTAAKSKEIEEMAATHSNELDSLRAANESAKAELLASLATSHSTELDDRQKASDDAKERELSTLRSSHAEELQKATSTHEATLAQQLESLRAEHETNRSAAIEALRIELEATHSQQLENVRRELETARLTEIEALQKGEGEAAMIRLQERKQLEDAHAKALESLQFDHHTALEEARVQERGDLESTHAKALVSLQSDHEAALEDARAHERQRLETAHAAALASLQAEHQNALEEARLQERRGLEAAHATALASLQDQHQTALDHASADLKEAHAKELASAASLHDVGQSDAINALTVRHEEELARLRSENDASMAKTVEQFKTEHSQALEALKASHEDNLLKNMELLKSEHSRAMEAHENDSLSQRERLAAEHAAELEALRRSLVLAPPSLALSSMDAIETEPIESPMRSPKRDAFILPRETEQPQTPVNGRIGRRDKETSPLILEDDTRQSPNAVSAQETPESQRPFKEMSTNTDARPVRKQTDQSSQTALTAKSMDQMVQGRQRRSSQGSVIITPPFDDTASISSVIRGRPSQESVGSVVRAKPNRDTGTLSTPEPVPARRPGSSASVRSAMQNPPPLPANHREAIEAARSHSSTGTRGAMGPPIMPASAYKSSASRPHTPSINSPPSVLGTPTPRAGGSRTHLGTAHSDMHSPTRLTTRSRRSSVSSFASEIDTRFNIRGDMMEAAGLGPGTDPRMIQAITQTMIGEYLWKYTRKAGRGEMSGNRHRRYFWVHPYTRTLYWSERDPSSAGRSELRAKSVPIEAVRVVTDDNPMPPGLHRKSLVVISPGRTVKFTCTTGQRHETWFNALSYLLLRTGTEQQADAEDMAGHITQEDLDEFNPSSVSRTARAPQSRAPPSLSSYNSRTTRTETPSVDMAASMSIPTLTPTHERGMGARSGTLSKLSGYWKASTISGSFSSRRGRNPVNGSAIYQASEVHDSAEDLRQMIEQQDRESDRLENVRACCDGKHDVGTLSHTSKRGRLSNLHSHTHHAHAHAHAHPGPSTTPTPMGSVRSRA